MEAVRVSMVRPEPAVDPSAVVEATRGLVEDPQVLAPRTAGGLVHAEIEGRAADVPALRAAVAAAAEGSGWDVAVLHGALLGQVGLLVLDVDSTLITAEVIELLAEHAGSREEVAAVTERAMRGEIDFAESLRQRVATLAGVPVQALAEVTRRVQLSPGASELVARAREHGATVGLVSGGFTEVVTPLAGLLGISHLRANALEVAGDRLTGRVAGEVVDRATKAVVLRQWAAELGVAPGATVAVGDGANDLDMLAAAGLGVAYRAKPVVAAAADVAVRSERLDVVAELLRW